MRRRRRPAGCRRTCGRSPRGSRCAPGTAAAPRPRWPRRSRSTVSIRGPMSGQISAQTSRAGRPERPRVLLAERVAPVGVVAEERQLRAPRHPHREARAEQDLHDARAGCAARLRRAERRRRPVDREQVADRPPRRRAGRRARCRPPGPARAQRQALGGVGDDVEDLDQPRETEDALHRRRAVDGHGELVPVLLRALLLADDHAEPAGVDERDLAQVEHERSRLRLAAVSAVAQLRRGREIDLAAGDHDDRPFAGLTMNLEQRVERHRARRYRLQPISTTGDHPYVQVRERAEDLAAPAARRSGLGRGAAAAGRAGHRWCRVRGRRVRGPPTGSALLDQQVRAEHRDEPAQALEPLALARGRGGLRSRTSTSSSPPSRWAERAARRTTRSSAASSETSASRRSAIGCCVDAGVPRRSRPPAGARPRAARAGSRSGRSR